jgi:hypothetical protein
MLMAPCRKTLHPQTRRPTNNSPGRTTALWLHIGSGVRSDSAQRFSGYDDEAAQAVSARIGGPWCLRSANLMITGNVREAK